MGSGKSVTPDEYARAVSAEVRSLMGKHRISGVKLSQETKLSQNYLAKRLRDELPFTLNDIQAIAKALGTTYTELVVPPAIERDRSLGRKPRGPKSTSEVPK